MKFYEKDEAARLLNELGKGDEPFIFAVNFDESRTFISLLKDVNPDELLYSFPGFRNDEGLSVHRPERIAWDTRPESPESYRRKFETVRKNIYAGNSFLVNLTCAVPVVANLAPKEIFLLSDAPYKLWVKDRFVCFSPETFVRIKDGIISSYPMKGTISAAVPDAENVLMQDRKEAAEHATVVDLIRNDLSSVAENVRVSRYRYVERLHTNKGDILQTSSEISGELPQDYRNHIGDIILSLLPAGSITGAPKPKTVEIIREAEDYERGFYTGIAGICCRGELTSAVLIRFIEETPDGLVFKAGGGITCNSVCDDEYKEVIQKAYVPVY